MWNVYCLPTCGHACLQLCTYHYESVVSVVRFSFKSFSETGGLFGLAVRLMQLFSDNKR